MSWENIIKLREVAPVDYTYLHDVIAVKAAIGKEKQRHKDRMLQLEKILERVEQKEKDKNDPILQQTK